MELFAHRGVHDRSNPENATPQTNESLREARRYGLNIEVDSSKNGYIGHVKDTDTVWQGGEYDQNQAAFEELGAAEMDALDIPELRNVAWQTLRRGGKLLDEIKASSPEAATKAADESFTAIEDVYGALASHNLDTYEAVSTENSVQFMSFSVEALDTIANRQQDTEFETLERAPKVLLGTSRMENVHDMSMSATVLGAMKAEGIPYEAQEWSHSLIDLAAARGYDGVAPHWSVANEEVVAYAVEKDVGFGAWVVPAEKIDELAEMGVETIVTEDGVPYEREKLAEIHREKRAKRLAQRAMK